MRLPGDLLRQAKRLAMANDQTLTELFTEALRHRLAARERQERGRPFRLITFKGRGIRPGVNLDDTSALLDRMDGFPDPARR